MKKKWIAFFLACCMAASAAIGMAEGAVNRWKDEDRARLRVGNPTAMRGRFFTSLWGGTTSDLDVQDLLHAYSPVCYDIGLSRFRFDHSVVQEAAAMDDGEGNRTYLLVFYDDLKWSDGTAITAADYAFSILFAMDPVISETGGKTADYSWLYGAEEYLNHTASALSGVRILSDNMLQIKVKAEALPYFYELSRLRIHPSPIQVIAPGIRVADDGEGAYLTEPLEAETIRETVLDPGQGYLSHPTVVSGPYTLTYYAWPTARFTINPYFKGTEDGILPRIGEIEYTIADNRRMLEDLFRGRFGLLNKVTLSDSIMKGVQSREAQNYAYDQSAYARTGLTMLWFSESSEKIQELAVRKAIAYCFDREGFIQEYAGPYGMQMDGLYGLGQWMFRLAAGLMELNADEKEPGESNQATGNALEGINLDGLTRYAPDARETARLLEDAGWKKTEDGIRHKTVNGEETELRLVLGIPESTEAKDGLGKYLIPNLEAAGFAVTLRPMSMDELERNYRGEEKTADLIYLGENFTILVDPEILAPTEENDGGDPQNSLTAVKSELYRLALETVRTEPADLPGFMRKWVKLQEEISKNLPLIPVYSNVYFDFFTRELHDYRITQAVTWGEAVTKSFISDAEEPSEEEKQKEEEQWMIH